MKIIYSFSIHIYAFIVWLASFYSPKAKSWIKGRKIVWAEINAPKNKKVYWFHCASLGEFDQAIPLINLLKKGDDSLFIVVTFFSPSGMEHYHKRNAPVDFAMYLPIDTKRNAKKFMQVFQPEKCFFVKYEFWFYFLKEAKASGAKVFSICAIFRKDHRFFTWYGAFFRKILSFFDHFFVQNMDSIQLLKTIGIENVSLVGDMRFDRVIENKKNCTTDEVAKKFLNGKKAFLIGSSWPVDEQFLFEFIQLISKEYKIILVPHDISENHIKEIEKRFENATIRFTKFHEKSDKKDILIVDTIGKLSNLYQYGFFAYVGGGFTGKLHNVLEPAVFGLPIIFGPKHQRFPEAQMLLDEKVAFSVNNSTKLIDILREIETNQEEIKKNLAKLIETQAGAAEKIAKQI